MPCNPDEFLALSNATASINDNLNETRRIPQAKRNECDELQLDVEKLEKDHDLDFATVVGTSEDTGMPNVHQVVQVLETPAD